MTIWLVLVGGRVNSAWSSQSSATAHVERLIEVNGDRIAWRIQEIEVRT